MVIRHLYYTNKAMIHLQHINFLIKPIDSMYPSTYLLFEIFMLV